MKLLLTTVIRHSKVGEDITGRVIELEWPSGKILRQFPTPDPLHPTSNLNPRGGLRGGRGVKFFDRRYFVANYDTVYIYNQDWQRVGQVSHPLSVDIHEIDVDEEGIWVTCSRCDLVLQLGFDGELRRKWHISDSTDLVRRLKIQQLPLDLTLDYRRAAPDGIDQTHLNSIQLVDRGVVCLNLGRVIPLTARRNLVLKLMGHRSPSAMGRFERQLLSRLQGVSSVILKLDLTQPERVEILAQIPTLRPSHNGVMLDADKLALAHETGFLQIIRPGRTRPTFSIEVPGNWHRGLTKLDGERVVVGTGPCGLVELNLRSRDVGPSLQLSGDPNESVHGLTTVED